MTSSCRQQQCSAKHRAACITVVVQISSFLHVQMVRMYRGDGFSDTPHGKVRWSQGDVFVVPTSDKITHHASKESTQHGGAAFYWVTDEPLCKYLGVSPTEKRFEPAHFTQEVGISLSLIGLACFVLVNSQTCSL